MPERGTNVLFIMCDQLRRDYLGCYGHPHLATPNIDRVAARGLRFTRAYAQSAVCGPSRMSFYTGRYVSSHGSTWNGVPLRVGERTLGDYLSPLGVRTALAGKTHMTADVDGMAMLGLDPDSEIGVRVAECGFEPFDRDDGLYPEGPEGAYSDASPRYNAYLSEQGFPSDNGWQEWANSADGDDGEILSGWFMRHAVRPARVPEQHSETPYMTRRAMAFIEEAGGSPWCLHLSYIKPHWPYIVPAPYHQMYAGADVVAARRSDGERRDPHPVYGAFMDMRVSRAFSRDEVRHAVIPAYMGLVKQIDDQIGVLLEFLERRGELDRTLIVFTSDHGDYLGDHWLGEKDMLHDCAAKIPLIVSDPRPEAEATRGETSEALVEAIDVVPTILDWYGGDAQPHRLEGRSLLPLLEGAHAQARRDYVVSECDYAFLPPRAALGVPVSSARLTMVATERWKYLHAEGFRPMLFDLERDPDELEDLGADPGRAQILRELGEMHFEWARRLSRRVTVSDADVERRTGRAAGVGILIGFWDEEELSP